MELKDYTTEELKSELHRRALLNKKQYDRERYLRNRERRLEYQRRYYADHREQVCRSVRNSEM